MFPSSGFFKNSPCPFLAEGACERSHCHFKHERPTQTLSSTSDVIQEDLYGQSDNNHDSSAVLKIDVVKDAVEKVYNVIQKEQQRDLSHLHGNYMPYDPSISKPSLQGGVSVPAVHTKLPSTMPGVTGKLEYRPTPIAELRKLQAAGVKKEQLCAEYDPTCPSTSVAGNMGYHPTPITGLDNSDARKELTNKYSEALKYHGTDMEYDPIMNYSAIPKQQKRKLLISEEGETLQQVRKQRKMERDHIDADSNQDDPDLIENTTGEAVNSSDETDLRLIVSESDTVLETDTENKTMLSTENRLKDPEYEIESKKLTKKVEVLGRLKKIENDSNISSRSEKADTKKRKDSKHRSDLKNAKTHQDQSETSGGKAAGHGDVSSVKGPTISRQKHVISEVDNNKKKSTRKSPAKELDTTQKESQKHCKKKSLKTNHSSSSESGSKGKTAESAAKKSSKGSKKVKMLDKNDTCAVVNLESEEDSSLSEREKKRRLKKTKHEEIRRSLPEDIVYVSSTSDESNMKYGNLVEEEKKRIKYLKHSVTLTKGKAIEQSSKVAEKFDWIKSSKQEGKQKGKDRTYSKHEKEKAQKSSRTQKKLIPKSKSVYDFSLEDSESGNDKRKDQACSKSGPGKGSCDKGGKPKTTHGIKVSHADLFGEDSEDDVSMPMGDGTSQDSSSDDITSGLDLDPEELRRLEEEEFEDSEDPYEECLRIFQETHGKLADDKMGSVEDSRENVHEEEVHFTSLPGQAGKKRTAHQASFDTSNMRRITQKPPRPSASQQMYNRYQRVQETAAAAAAAPVESQPQPIPSSPTSLLSSAAHKKRVAHRPKIAPPSGKYTLNSKRGSGTSHKTLDKSPTPTASTTLAKTAPKGGRRVAHTPAPSTLKRPTVPAEFGSKIPTSTRQQYLNKIVDECLLICGSEQAAYDRALKEEKDCYDRCTARQGYLTAAVSTIRRLRSEHGQTTSPAKGGSSHQLRPKMSHAAVLGGSRAAHTSFSIHRHTSLSSQDSLQGAELYKQLLRYALTEEQLKENGFPRSDLDKPGSAVLFKEQPKKSSDPTIKYCARCGKQFTVLNNNRYLKRDECVYHHGKLWKRRVAGAVESRYNCCQGDAQAEGCCTGELHVWDSRKEDMEGYVSTLQKSPTDDPGVFALDCEMCYTYGGMELTRVSVVNWKKKLVYETLVKPENKVIDYNTRFSGIKEEDMAGVDTSLRDVQAVLLSMFSADTLLLGHSLESDLLALKVIHSKVVDTSVVFPHKRGLPFKRALRTLMNDFLQKIIQNDVGGHDSKEDAVACVDLMKWRLKEDIRANKL